jgi:hypothetical protein
MKGINLIRQSGMWLAHSLSCVKVLVLDRVFDAKKQSEQTNACKAGPVTLANSVLKYERFKR